MHQIECGWQFQLELPIKCFKQNNQFSEFIHQVFIKCTAEGIQKAKPKVGKVIKS